MCAQDKDQGVSASGDADQSANGDASEAEKKEEKAKVLFLSVFIHDT